MWSISRRNSTSQQTSSSSSTNMREVTCLRILSTLKNLNRPCRLPWGQILATMVGTSLANDHRKQEFTIWKTTFTIKRCPCTLTNRIKTQWRDRVTVTLQVEVNAPVVLTCIIEASEREENSLQRRGAVIHLNSNLRDLYHQPICLSSRTKTWKRNRSL